MEQKVQESEDAEQELEVYRTAFEFFDENGDGTISLSELKSAMQRLGANPSDKDMENIIAGVDDNGNGSLEFPEFVTLMKNRKETTDEIAELIWAFKTFDRDGNGFLDPKELRIALKHLGEPMTEEEVNELIKTADKNSDGLIDLNEFIAFFTGNSTPHEASGNQTTTTMGLNLTV